MDSILKSESFCYECDNTFKKVFKLQNHTYIYIFSTNSIIKICLQVIKTPQVWSLFRLSFSCENNIIYPWETIFRSKLNGDYGRGPAQGLQMIFIKTLRVLQLDSWMSRTLSRAKTSSCSHSPESFPHWMRIIINQWKHHQRHNGPT